VLASLNPKDGTLGKYVIQGIKTTVWRQVLAEHDTLEVLQAQDQGRFS
jgi:hypothetical protein